MNWKSKKFTKQQILDLELLVRDRKIEIPKLPKAIENPTTEILTGGDSRTQWWVYIEVRHYGGSVRSRAFLNKSDDQWELRDIATTEHNLALLEDIKSIAMKDYPEDKKDYLDRPEDEVKAFDKNESMLSGDLNMSLDRTVDNFYKHNTAAEFYKKEALSIYKLKVQVAHENDDDQGILQAKKDYAEDLNKIQDKFVDNVNKTLNEFISWNNEQHKNHGVFKIKLDAEKGGE